MFFFHKCSTIRSNLCYLELIQQISESRAQSGIFYQNAPSPLRSWIWRDLTKTLSATVELLTERKWLWLRRWILQTHDFDIRCQFAYIKWLQINTSDKKNITSIFKTSVISNMQHQYSFDEMINRSFFSSRKLKCLPVKARKLYNIYGSFNKPALSISFPSVLTRLTHEDCLLSLSGSLNHRWGRYAYIALFLRMYG